MTCQIFFDRSFLLRLGNIVIFRKSAVPALGVPALVDAGAGCDLRPPLNCQRPRRRGTPPPPSSRSIRSSPVRQGRTVRLHSLVSPSGWPCTDVPPAQTILPPALGHLAVQTAPAHKSNRQRVSVGLGGQECWPACAVQHIQSTSPQTPAYLTSQS